MTDADVGQAVGEWLAGASMGSFDEGVEEAIRHALAEQQGEVARLVAAYDAAVKLCLAAGLSLEEEGGEAFGAWDARPWWYGYTVGRGDAMIRAARVLADVGNAMRLKAAAIGGAL